MKNNLEITTIRAKTLPEAWFTCVRGLFERESLTHTYVIDHGSYEGQRRLEYDYVVVRIEYPGSRPIVPDTPAGIPPPSTVDYVEQYLPYLMSSNLKENEQYTYGMYLEPQIQKVIQMYKKYGHGTNQAYMTVGDMNSIDLSDPPCLRGIDTRIIDGKLHFIVYFRSWDLWAGFPSNLAAIQLLKEYMALEIGVQDGNIIANSKGLHLYEYSWELARTVVRR